MTYEQLQKGIRLNEEARVLSNMIRTTKETGKIASYDKCRNRPIDVRLDDQVRSVIIFHLEQQLASIQKELELI